jgi:hypothetical protein
MAPFSVVRSHSAECRLTCDTVRQIMPGERFTQCAKGGVAECVANLHLRFGVLDAFFVVAGIVVIFFATGLAIRTFMVPQGAPPVFNRFVFRLTQAFFDVLTRFARTDKRRHIILSLYAPVSLLAVLGVVLLLIGFGYTLAYYGVGIKPLIRAFLFSGSALSTLGFESPGNNFWVIVFSAAEALTVATVVALLIGYLPNIYSSYQQREQAVSNLDDLTGAPPDGIKVVDSYAELFGVTKLGDLWQTWLQWFNDLRSSGSTLSGELYLRSSRWDRSWICAAGAILDAASLVDACLDLTTDPAAVRLVHLGSRSLREVLEPLQLHCPITPQWPQTAINVTQQEFDEAYSHFQNAGLPMKLDRDAAWKTFAQHRVQYECALMALVRLKKPPRGARWTTDRAEATRPLTLPVFGLKNAACDPSKELCPPGA